jgi:hypothetical protein
MEAARRGAGEAGGLVIGILPTSERSEAPPRSIFDRHRHGERPEQHQCPLQRSDRLRNERRVLGGRHRPEDRESGDPSGLRLTCGLIESGLAEALGRRNNFGIETILREIIRIEGYDEIRFALFGAQTKGIVFRIRGNLNRGPDVNLFGSFTNEINDGPDSVRTDAQAF